MFRTIIETAICVFVGCFHSRFDGAGLKAYWQGDTTIVVERYYGNGTIRQRELLKRKGLLSYRENGLSQRWYEDGSPEAEAEVVNGKLHGRMRAWYASGVLRRECSFDYGQMHGQSKWYWPNGRIRQYAQLVRGKYQGRFRYWKPDGRLCLEGFWKNGNKDGVWTFWDGDGNVLVRRTYVEGALIRSKEYGHAAWAPN
jgi:antitoxin component YwqK of YwqJK toxin-antitoxin module